MKASDMKSAGGKNPMNELKRPPFNDGPSHNRIDRWMKAHPKGAAMIYANVWLLFTIIPIADGLLMENGLRKYLYLGALLAFNTIYIRVWLIYPSMPSSEHGASPSPRLWSTITVLTALETAASFLGHGHSIQLLIFIAAVIAYTIPQPSRKYALMGLLAFAGLQIGLLVHLSELNSQEAWASYALLCILTGVFSSISQILTFQKELEIKNKTIEQLTQESERERISSDLHDIVGQTLTAIALKTQLSLRLLEMPDQRERMRQELREAAALSHQALADVRAVVRNARKLRVEEEVMAARELLYAAGITPVISGDPVAMNEQTERAAAHVVREAVANVVHHAAATRCLITTSASSVRIENDGISDPNETKKTEANGLAGLEHRVNEAGGVLSYGRIKRGWAVEATFSGDTAAGKKRAIH